MWRHGGVVTQRSAKPRTPVQFRVTPPSNTQNYGTNNKSLGGGIGIRDGLKIRWW